MESYQHQQENVILWDSKVQYIDSIYNTQQFSEDFTGVCGNQILVISERGFKSNNQEEGQQWSTLNITISIPSICKESLIGIALCDKNIKNKNHDISNIFAVNGPPQLGLVGDITKDSHIRKALPLTISSLGSFIKMFKYLDSKSNGMTESLLGGLFNQKKDRNQVGPIHDFDEEAKKLYKKLNLPDPTIQRKNYLDFDVPDVVWVNPKNNAKFYIGNIGAAQNIKILQKLDIYHIVNCQGTQGENYFESDKNFKYLRFGISQNMYSAPLDSPMDVLEFFSEVHNFIDEALNNGKNVMVHCLAGAHRAGTTGVSYMMKAGKMSFNEALRVAKTQRPVVDPMGELGNLLLKLESAYKQLGYDGLSSIQKGQYSQQNLNITLDILEGKLTFVFEEFPDQPQQIIHASLKQCDPSKMRLICNFEANVSKRLKQKTNQFIQITKTEYI